MEVEHIQIIKIDEDNSQEIIRRYTLDESIYSDYHMFRNTSAIFEFLEHSKQKGLAIEHEPVINQIQS